MQTYGIDSRSYLGRAKHLLGQPDASALFYAAFELRCGVEARLQEYLEFQDHVPSGNKKDWRVSALGKAAARAFTSASNKIARVVIKDRAAGEVRATLFFTPVSPELQKLAERLGDYLHVGRQLHPPDDPWWANFRTNLDIAVRLLEDATFGTLLGPPLRNTKDGRLYLPLEVPEGSPHPRVARGDKTVLDIRYFDSLADARGDAA